MHFVGLSRWPRSSRPRRIRLAVALLVVSFVTTSGLALAPRAEAAPWSRGKARVGKRRLTRDLKALFRQVPKTELHMHLGGSTPIKILRDFHVENGTPRRKVRKQTRIAPVFRSLNDFLKTYYRVAIDQSPSQMERAAEALVKEVAKENVRYVEIRSSITGKKGTEPKEIAAAIERGARARHLVL